jgi:ribose transport system substrate-binding protein
VLVGQKYFGWGSESVKLLYDIKQGKMPPATVIDSGLDIVTRDTLDAYIATWKKMERGS